MSYLEFRKKVIENLVKYKNSKYPGLPLGDFNNNKYEHILPLSCRDKNLLPEARGLLPSQYHQYAHHLNSSQMMCVNFFSVLTRNEVLIRKFLSELLEITFDSNSKLTDSKFEYTPNGKKFTNFDYFCEFSCGRRFYFEIKYTESDFGSPLQFLQNQKRYTNVWNTFYENQVKKSEYLSRIDMQSFFANYQINRNIAYVSKSNHQNEYVCFIYPRENSKLDNFLKMKVKGMQQVRPIYWIDAYTTIYNITKDDQRLKSHYQEFYDKYLGFNQE